MYYNRSISRELVERIKSLLLKNYIIACCYSECLEPLKSIANVVYLDKVAGLALIEKTQDLKEFLEIDDNMFRDLRVLAFYKDAYCGAEMFLGEIDSEKAEEIALAALAIVELSKLRNPVAASTQYS
jgi:hypothetical protein